MERKIVSLSWVLLLSLPLFSMQTTLTDVHVAFVDNDKLPIIVSTLGVITPPEVAKRDNKRFYLHVTQTFGSDAPSELMAGRAFSKNHVSIKTMVTQSLRLAHQQGYRRVVIGNFSHLNGGAMALVLSAYKELFEEIGADFTLSVSVVSIEPEKYRESYALREQFMSNHEQFADRILVAKCDMRDIMSAVAANIGAEEEDMNTKDVVLIVPGDGELFKGMMGRLASTNFPGNYSAEVVAELFRKQEFDDSDVVGSAKSPLPLGTLARALVPGSKQFSKRPLINPHAQGLLIKKLSLAPESMQLCVKMCGVEMDSSPNEFLVPHHRLANLFSLISFPQTLAGKNSGYYTIWQNEKIASLEHQYLAVHAFYTGHDFKFGDLVPDPILCTKSGNSFSRNVMTKWLADDTRDPLTQEQITLDDFVENEALALAYGVAQYRLLSKQYTLQQLAEEISYAVEAIAPKALAKDVGLDKYYGDLLQALEQKEAEGDEQQIITRSRAQVLGLKLALENVEPMVQKDPVPVMRDRFGNALYNSDVP